MCLTFCKKDTHHEGELREREREREESGTEQLKAYPSFMCVIDLVASGGKKGEQRRTETHSRTLNFYQLRRACARNADIRHKNKT